MSIRRGQMFVVTTIFLVGFIFVVQQLLFQYMSVDPKGGFEFNEYGIVKSLAAAANATLQGSSNCAALERDIEILKSFVDERSSTAGYSVSLKYTIDCSVWGNAPPNPAPLNISIRVLGSRIDSTSRFSFYKG